MALVSLQRVSCGPVQCVPGSSQDVGRCVQPERKAALFIHLVGVLMLVSGQVVAALSLEIARRQRVVDTSAVAQLLRVGRFGAVSAIVGSVVLLGGGVWLAVLDGTRGAWFVASLAMFAAAVVLGFFGGRHPKRARLLATALSNGEWALQVRFGWTY